LSSILEKIVRHKRAEIAETRQRVSVTQLHQEAGGQTPPRDFLGAIRHPRTGENRIPVALIAEVKKASPSKGVIRQEFDPVSISRIYAQHGADCLSVLTDEKFFQGHLDYLRGIRNAVELPLLRKDFVLDEYQVLEARAAGADAVLLIAECLEPTQLRDLAQAIRGLGMTALIEVHNPQNLEFVLECKPLLIGINNRDLNTFQVDLMRTMDLKKRIPDDILVISESGIETATDVQKLARAGVAAVLVGESLMRQGNIGLAARNLMHSR
jgi:indole-3-glycerol phosphate synthase